MNEQGCAFVVLIATVLAVILSAYVMITGDTKMWWALLALGVVINMISGVVIVCRYM